MTNHTRTFDEQIASFAHSPSIHAYVRRLTFCGPTEREVIEAQAKGWATHLPTLDPCAIKRAIGCVEKVVEVVVRDVRWADCFDHSLRHCWASCRRQRLKSLELARITHGGAERTSALLCAQLATRIQDLRIKSLIAKGSGASYGDMMRPLRVTRLELDMNLTRKIITVNHFPILKANSLRHLRLYDVNSRDVDLIGDIISGQRESLHSMLVAFREVDYGKSCLPRN